MRGSDFYSDTDPRVMEVWLSLLRKMPPEKKMAAVFEMNDMLMGLVKGEVRRLYPQADEREVFLRMAARRLDRETMIRVYGWDPESHG